MPTTNGATQMLTFSQIANMEPDELLDTRGQLRTRVNELRRSGGYAYRTAVENLLFLNRILREQLADLDG